MDSQIIVLMMKFVYSQQ